MVPVMRSIFDLGLSDLNTLVASWGGPPFRARQIWQGLYQQLWNSPDQFSDLPAPMRQKLASELAFETLLPDQSLASTDQQTVKTLFRLQDGRAIEAVLMMYEKRRTLCISTQVGCAMGCVFCATGQMGFRRHLTSGEIVAQVLYYARLLRSQGEQVSNIVVMGMGEPFHNYDNTLQAIDCLNDPSGFNLGARRFTISTVGLVPAIRRFAQEKRQINLAISLHAASDSLRSSMLPVNTSYPLDVLLEACRQYIATTNRRISFEWALVQGVNDTAAQAHLLAQRLQGMLCHVNAIPLNPTPGFSGQGASRERARNFQEILIQSGIPCTIRLRRGVEISAGCGQLAVNR
jgi:23S rRNA (adenine2503-C2)-methyltransferase